MAKQQQGYDSEKLDYQMQIDYWSPNSNQAEKF